MRQAALNQSAPRPSVQAYPPGAYGPVYGPMPYSPVQPPPPQWDWRDYFVSIQIADFDVILTCVSDHCSGIRYGGIWCGIAFPSELVCITRRPVAYLRTTEIRYATSSATFRNCVRAGQGCYVCSV